MNLNSPVSPTSIRMPESSSLGNYSVLLESLYASLWDDAGFDHFLAVFRDHFNSISATLMAVNIKPRYMRYGWSVGVPEEFTRWYIENDMVSKDPAIDLFEAISEQEKGFISAGLMLDGIDLIDTVTDEFKPWLIAENIIDTAGLVIPYSEHEHLILALQRNEKAGIFKAHEIEQLNLLVAHIKQAVQLFIMFYHQQRDNNSLQAAINTLSQPTIVINEFMEVRHINPAAEKLTSTSEDFYIDQNKFYITNSALQHQFMYQAWDMTRASEHIDRELTSTLVIPRKQHPMTLTFSPMFTQEENAKSRGVLLQIFDPATQTLPSANRIKSIFRLSKAEATLCEYLLQGCTLKDVAEERNVSINTVREQMRNVFTKTGYNRQSELIAAILRAIP